MTFDQHPSAIVPADYQFIAFTYLPRVGWDVSGIAIIAAERARLRAFMERTQSSFAVNESAGNCYVCGAHCSYMAAFYHRPTNTVIKTGLDCADNLEMGDATAFRRNVTRGLEAQAGKRKAIKFLADNNLTAAWDIASAPCPTDERGNCRFEELTIRDIVSKLVKYGSISEKQVAFLARLLTGITNRAALQAARAAAQEAAAPCPSGKVTIEGTILSLRTQDGPYGSVLKMLVQHDTGFKIWSTVPAAISDAAKGSRIRFTATVTPSQDDQKFGFASRPAQASILQTEDA